MGKENSKTEDRTMKTETTQKWSLLTLKRMTGGIQRKKYLGVFCVAAIVAIAGIFYACKKDNNIRNNFSSDVKIQKSDSPYEFIGQLHNEILETYLVALEANPELDAMDFMCNYGEGIDREKHKWFIEKMVEQMLQYSSLDELFTDLEDKGIYSSNCMNIMRDIISFAIEQPNVSMIHQFRCDIFNQYTFDEYETDLVVGSLSILEYSTIYWADENRILRWEEFRIDTNDEPIMKSCYGDFRNAINTLWCNSSFYNLIQGKDNIFSTMNDLVGSFIAINSINCINREYIEYPDFQITGKKQRATFVASASAEASGRM